MAFEQSPANLSTIVSVVTNDTSDDANGPSVDAKAVYLRVYWDGKVFAFHHHSLDGRLWNLARLFSLPLGAGEPTVEMTAQSPVGDDCTVDFSQVSWQKAVLPDLRDGS
ncbi:DUF1349 domain-containing protein [Pseudooceanicola algae]|uniref:Uncharacterized protein n=1 Tax=Pseudooceanicola algae TaxID=1537215 RepID=A0A418SK23_9RHOB|nr:DUF1349 domain-containing protein [Pseudooceanicola algae]QPM92174.1 hypothetical protein PSAL_034380 [Pseudooceanicola algae]